MVTAVRYPPGPKSALPGGQMLAFRRDAIGLLTRLARQYGDVPQLGPEQVTLLNHPDYIRDVLVTHQRNFTKSRALQWAKFILREGLLTSEGEVHVRQRRLAQPAFQRQRIPTYGAVMAAYAQRLQERWQGGETRDIDQEMARLTLAIASKTLFDADVEDDARDIGAALTTILQLFPRFMLPFSNLIGKLPLPSNRQAEQAHKLLDTVIYRIIQERRASGIDKGDLLSMLLAARDEEGDGGGMSDQQLRDEAMTIFLAGQRDHGDAADLDVVSVVPAPAVETQLHTELDTVLARHLPVVEDMPRLPTPDGACRGHAPLSTCLDHWPPCNRGVRSGGVRHPCHIHCGPEPVYHAARRAFFLILGCLTQRWTPEAEAARPKFAYFPFGGGARQCIGEGFAWMEGNFSAGDPRAAVADAPCSWSSSGSEAFADPAPQVHGMRMILERRQVR